MDRNTKYAIVIILILGLGVVTIDGMKSLSPLVSGYGGITAEIIGGSARASGTAPVNVRLNGTTATVDPAWGGWFLPDPGTVECEVQGKLNILDKELKDTHNETIDNKDGTYTHRLWEEQDVYLEMTVVVRTKTGGGNDPTYDTVFTIMLDENEFNVFDAPDDVIAYIMEVYTLEPITTDDEGKTEGTPSSGGFYFTLEPHGTNPVPQWLIDGGYQDEILSGLSEVSFDIKADYMEATVGPWVRYEHELSWKIGVTARVFGYWTDTGTNKDFNPRGGETPWWEALFGGIFGIFGEIIKTVMIALVVVLAVYVAVNVYRQRRD